MSLDNGDHGDRDQMIDTQCRQSYSTIDSLDYFQIVVI